MQAHGHHLALVLFSGFFQFALLAGFLLGIGLTTVGLTFSLFACFLLGIGLAAVGFTLSSLLLSLLLGFVIIRATAALALVCLNLLVDFAHDLVCKLAGHD